MFNESLMWDKIIASPDLAKYHTTYEKGQIIFFEGDDSQDLYFLVSGQLDIFRGKTKIREIAETGSLFGEMSFLLGGKRTATVKASNDVRAIRIPKDQVSGFLRQFPDLSQEICSLLARRLDETSQILYGLKTFCDHVPDAVILTDKEGKIITWNTAAEKLYGRDWDKMRRRSVEDIYEEPQRYKDFLEEVQLRHAVREKVLKIRHPERGTRYISTSTTVLYDGHNNFQGVLSLGRDVTMVKTLERRYRRARNWLIPAVFLLGLLAASVFFGHPYFSKYFRTTDIEKRGLRNQIAKDYLLLKSLLVEHFAVGDRSKTSQLMKDFLRIQDTSSMPYTGLILLDKEKTVFDAYSMRAHKDTAEMLGETYAGTQFQGSEESLHEVLSFYRADKDHPMGYKGIEVAFELNKDNEFLGWLVFQMDVDLLREAHGIDEEGLKEFRFD